MKTTLAYVCSCLLLSTASIGQAVRFNFQVMDEKSGIASSLLLVANGEHVITNSTGSFKLTLNPSIDNIRVQSADQSRYVIKYPADGIILLPKNPSNITRITIGPPTSTDLSKALKNQIAGQMTKIEQHLRGLQENDERLRAELKKSLDSLSGLAQDNHITETELRTARELLDGKDRYLPLISSALNNYVNESKDLLDAFRLGNIILSQRKAINQLDTAIRSNNLAYETLNNAKDDFEKAIENYWQSKELSLNFMNITDFAINEIHRPYVLPLNDVIEKINRMYLETNKKRKKQQRKEILAQLAPMLPPFERRLTILAEKSATLITILKSLGD